MAHVMTAPNPPVVSSTHKTPFSPCSPPCSPFQPRHMEFSSVRSETQCGEGGVDFEETRSFKRKRPPRLEVTASPSWSLMDLPGREEERVGAVEEEGDGYSVYCKRGKRGFMEDRYCAVVHHGGACRKAFFGVFDGHGGSKAAEYCAKNLEKNIMTELSSTLGERSIENALRNAYLKTDSDFLEEDENGGSCCVTAVIRDGDLVVSNAGDCRAVMSRGGNAEALTSDHHASVENEQKRIESLGGYVDCCNGVWRIQGTLAVSRGIGDRCLKRWVTAEPETRALKIQSDCEFLILASDGLWDKVTNQEAVDVVHSICIGVDKKESLTACKRLAELSIRRGSLDDVSVMIIQLHRFVA